MGNAKTTEIPVVWIQCATCTGCSVSVLNSVSPTIKNVLVDEVIPGKHINLRFQATLMAGAGDIVIEELDATARREKGKYVLIVEGAIPTAGKAGEYGSIGEKDGKPVSIFDRAAFGGIAAGEPNPAGCISVSEVFRRRNISTPLINIPGCAPHPDWFVGTVAKILLLGLPKPEELDEYKRPKDFYGQLIHENCPRRAYFDEGKFSKHFGEPGCLNELGCKGPVTHADCPLRLWNGGVNWCIGSGSPCIGCVEPGFPDLLAPFYQKLTEDALPNIGSSSR